MTKDERIAELEAENEELRSEINHLHRQNDELVKALLLQSELLRRIEEAEAI